MTGLNRAGRNGESEKRSVTQQIKKPPRLNVRDATFCSRRKKVEQDK